jgi:signal transduction histidine kinase/ActR/RegA family two-component response regulator
MAGARPFRYSIRGRAAILTSVLVAAALAAFTWLTIERVQADLIRRGIERAENTASTLALQTAQATQQGVTRLSQVAGGSAVQNFLRQPNDQTRAALIAAARSPNVTQEETVAVWDAAGHRLLDAPVQPSAPRTIPPEDKPPAGPGPTPLLTQGNVLFTRNVAEIRAGPNQSGPRLGYLVVSRVVSAAASTNVVNRVVGDAATVLIANQSGSVWTDLGGIVSAPQIDLDETGGREFLSATGERMIGAHARIPGTPWVLLLAFPRSVIIAPSWRLMGVLIAASILIVVAATLGARALSNRVTEPLAELTRAVQAIEQGDYSRRVLAQGRDEVGQLARAFNAMAEQVETGRRALQAHAAELSTSREAARRANESKDQFLAVLSHELRTPLNAILGWCQMLKGGITPPGGTERAIDVIERNATAQLRLVEDLLDVSRIVIGQFTLEKGRVDVRAVVNAAIESLQPSMDSKHIITTVTDAPPAAGRYVHGDANRLQQAVWNLLSNAIKFTPTGGRIQVELRSVDSQIEIAVRDNGEGIDPDALPRIFERLQQGDYGPARRHGGLGLGLAIVRQIVELHQGTVSAESEGAGRGATFRIRIPAIAQDSERSLPSGSHPAPVRGEHLREHPSLGGLRILVVEDSDDARDVMERLLTISGAAVVSCADAAAALQWLSTNTPDVIVSDIGMPGMDGWQLMQRIRSQPGLAAHDTPAIALTAHVTPADRDRSAAVGFQYHLAKPVDVAELLRLVASLGARRRDSEPSTLA